MKVFCKRCQVIGFVGEIKPGEYYSMTHKMLLKSKAVTQAAMLKHLTEKHQSKVADLINECFEFKPEVKT